MRDYLYIWNDTEQNAVVASGIEFKDLIPVLSSQEGIVLLKHESEIEDFDDECGFHFCPSSKLQELAREDIYSWGDFAWTDYRSAKTPVMSESEISELLFFAHKRKPLDKVKLSGIDNDFLCYTHDDGWFMKFYYSCWDKVEELLSCLVSIDVGRLDLEKLRSGQCGFWISGGLVIQEEKTYDIDSVLNRRI